MEKDNRRHCRHRSIHPSIHILAHMYMHPSTPKHYPCSHRNPTPCLAKTHNNAMTMTVTMALLCSALLPPDNHKQHESPSLAHPTNRTLRSTRQDKTSSPSQTATRLRMICRRRRARRLIDEIVSERARLNQNRGQRSGFTDLGMGGVHIYMLG